MECSLIWFSSRGLNCGLSLSVPYVPKFFGIYGGDDGTRTRDLCRDSEKEARNLQKTSVTST